MTLDRHALKFYSDTYTNFPTLQGAHGDANYQPDVSHLKHFTRRNCRNANLATPRRRGHAAPSTLLRRGDTTSPGPPSRRGDASNSPTGLERQLANWPTSDSGIRLSHLGPTALGGAAAALGATIERMMREGDQSRGPGPGDTPPNSGPRSNSPLAERQMQSDPSDSRLSRIQGEDERDLDAMTMETWHCAFTVGQPHEEEQSLEEGLQEL